MGGEEYLGILGKGILPGYPNPDPVLYALFHTRFQIWPLLSLNKWLLGVVLGLHTLYLVDFKSTCCSPSFNILKLAIMGKCLLPLSVCAVLVPQVAFMLAAHRCPYRIV